MAFGSDNSIYVSGGTTARLTQSPDLCAVQGGEVSSTAPLTNLCLGDGFADQIQLSVTGNTGTGRFGLVRQNDLALVAQNGTGSFNMENYPPGNYYVGHISFMCGGIKYHIHYKSTVWLATSFGPQSQFRPFVGKH